MAFFMTSFVSEQERLQEIPTQSNAISEGNLFAGGQEANALPGSEFDHLQHPSSQVGFLSLGVWMQAIFFFEYSGIYFNFHFFQGSAFLQNFRSSDQNRFADAWDDVQTPQMPLFQGRNGLNNIPFEHSQVQPNLEGEINLSINCMYTHSRTCFFCLFPDKCKNNHPCLI